MSRYLLKRIMIVAIFAIILMLLPWAKVSIHSYAKYFTQLGFIFCFSEGAATAFISIIKKDGLLSVAELKVDFAMSALFIAGFMVLEPSLFYVIFGVA